MNTKMNTAGYDLYEITEHEWIIHVKGCKLFTGTFKEVVKHMSGMGFELAEVEVAVKDMIQTGFNGSHFGMHKSFIFSFQREFGNDQKTG